MFCTKCGHNNADGTAFCTNCGNQMIPMAPPQGGYAPQPPQGEYAPFPQPPRPPKQRRSGLVAGLIIGGVILLAGIVVLVLWLMGVLFAGGSGVVGQWVNEDRMEIMIFDDDGDVELIAPNGEFDGTYEYDKGEKMGVIEFDEDLSVGGEYDFMVDDDKMAIEGVGEFELDKDEDTEFDYDEMGPLLGLWYEETGYGGTIEFKDGGNCTLEAMGLEIDGTYECDEKNGEGEITIEFMGEKSTNSFELDGKELNIEGSIYTRDEVEQMDMGDMMDELEDMDIDLSDY